MAGEAEGGMEFLTGVREGFSEEVAFQMGFGETETDSRSDPIAWLMCQNLRGPHLARPRPPSGPDIRRARIDGAGPRAGGQANTSIVRQPLRSERDTGAPGRARGAEFQGLRGAPTPPPPPPPPLCSPARVLHLPLPLRRGPARSPSRRGTRHRGTDQDRVATGFGKMTGRSAQEPGGVWISIFDGVPPTLKGDALTPERRVSIGSETWMWLREETQFEAQSPELR
ncbi:uncharacterized protein LOC118678950 [Myotis myotis]|uniref:uncharacterized protein LOC118678950 n=1 Tax=Myotis myotis TaxID=51298 RepID=UPI001748A3E3|nr:uncharacterized protein LOC118678950 [Myotis myotis]